MAKKKRFRLDANQKAQIMRQLQQDSAITPPIASAGHTATIASPTDRVVQKKTLPPSITRIEDVRRDIKKIGVVVGVLAVLLIVTFIIDKKYNFSLSIGQKITQGLGI